MRHTALDVAPLVAAVGSMARLVELTGADWRTLKRAEAKGMTVAQADRYAVACGSHPAIVWPAWLDLAEAERREREARRVARLRRTNHAYRDRQTAASVAYWAAHGEAIKAARRRRYRDDVEYRERRKRQARRVA